ncbi:MAG TPA: IS701 family transposase [Streptosporangiaceae bacterium]|nr:IS701 family transposase [Streptosporangiaceae bacterium]
MEKDNNPAAADATVDHDAHQGLLNELLGRVAPCFARRETRQTFRDMVHGLLTELEDHNCWTMGEAAGHPGPYRMQHLLSRARVDEQQMLDTAADWAAGHLGKDQDGHGDAVLIVDETADEKSSRDCAGAARQYSGTIGGIALCQVAVTLTYAAPAGHALIGRALYLPADWAADEERRELAGVPDEVMFATKPQLAGDLLEQAHGRGIRAGFIAGDEVYGSLDLRKSIRERGTGYVLAVRSNHVVTLPSGRRLTVKNAAGLVKPGMWQRMRTGSATKGAKDYHWAMIEITPDDTPDEQDDGHAILLLRRHRYTGTVSYYQCWSPGPVPLAKLISVAVTRWKIEEDHQLTKQVSGLDSGQVTTWTSWHRWTAISLLAYAFLAVAAACQRARDAGTDALGLIPVTIPELLRQLRGTIIPEPRRDKPHRTAWTLWRRRHQYQAQQAHQRWHAYADELPR